MGKSRDDFPQSVKDKARMRVNDRCSNPICRVPTCGPSHESPSAVNNIGKAAHISAAAPGGPRYDPQMQSTHRKSIHNAIWLCSNCADNIDNDTATFTIEILHGWKREAERLAHAELGTKLPSEKDSVNLLTTALSGSAISFIPSAIHNVKEATQNALEALDPRFKVQVSALKSGVHFTLLAKEPVESSILINPEFAPEFENKFSHFQDNGGEFSISASAITLKGSKIFDELHPLFKGGNFQFKGPRKDGAIQRIIVFSDSVEKGELRFDDIPGEIEIGDKTSTFKGSIFNDMLQFATTYLSETKQVKTKFEVDVNRWKSHDIFNLPFFDKIYHCVLALQNVKAIDMTLEVDGETVFTGVSERMGEQAVQNFPCLRYLFVARKVLKEFNQSIQLSTLYDEHAHVFLETYYNVLNGHKAIDPSSLSAFTVSVTAGMDIETFDIKPMEAGVILNISSPTLSIDGQTILVPPLATVICNLKAREGQKLSGFKAGEDFDVIFDLTPETVLITDFASNI